MKRLEVLLNKARFSGASDLHLKPDLVPRLRIRGVLEDTPDEKPLSSGEIEQAVREILTEEQAGLYEARGELDFATGDVEKGRFRCNVFREHRGVAAVFRRLAVGVPTLAELRLPSRLESFAHLKGGLALVTGPAGSGKTSTLAALVNIINSTYRKHIITLEDPIEYIHPPQKSIIHQRGLYYDFLDFAAGVKDSLREDVDILLIGEMRDVETIRMALTAAEAGHLVFATLHTNGAAASIDRIIDVFPAPEQPQIRAMVSQSLMGVVSQLLFTRVDREGRIPATELLFATPAVSNLIREGKVHEIMNVIQAGKGQGMHSMDDSLLELLRLGRIDPEDAIGSAVNKGRFEPYLVGAPG